jgi:hypothetical protein
LVVSACIPEQLTAKNKHLYDKECIADYKNPDGKYGLNKKLEETHDYLGAPALLILSNNQRMDLTAYGDDKIISRAKIT